MSPRLGRPRISLQRARLQRCPLSTSAFYHAQIPPESPRFIQIPKSVQAEPIYHPWVKGILPIPRKVASQKLQHERKDLPQYLAKITPEPKENKIEKADTNGYERSGWKARQAEHRRRNLREGLTELEHRERRRRQALTTRSSQRSAENMARRDAPEREDDRLTTPTVLQASLASRHPVSHDPNREARVSLKRQNAAETDRAAAERRKVMLQNLYVNAGRFIITEAQVEEAVNQAFDSIEQFKSDMRPGLNVWNLGPPDSTLAMLSRSGKNKLSALKAVETDNINEKLTRERVKRIAEELTGGKIN